LCVKPSKFLRQPDGRKLLLKLSVGVSFSVDNGTLKYREPERGAVWKIYFY
jgi:hypothetical protein